MDDLISRESVKEILNSNALPYHVVPNVWDAINQLPSAQPEIVRCKDCKHWIPYDWMFSEVWQSRNIADYPEDEMGCKWCDMSMKANDFCSRADRREVTNGN